MPQRPDAPPIPSAAASPPAATASSPAASSDDLATAATAPSGEGGGVRMVDPRIVPISKATDLGSVRCV